MLRAWCIKLKWVFYVDSYRTSKVLSILGRRWWRWWTPWWSFWKYSIINFHYMLLRSLSNRAKSIVSKNFIFPLVSMTHNEQHSSKCQAQAPVVSLKIFFFFYNIAIILAHFHVFFSLSIDLLFVWCVKIQLSHKSQHFQWLSMNWLNLWIGNSNFSRELIRLSFIKSSFYLIHTKI